jgi:hypothetical protein
MSQANSNPTTRRTVLAGIASVPATLAVASTLAAGTAVASAANWRTWNGAVLDAGQRDASPLPASADDAEIIAAGEKFQGRGRQSPSS